MSQQEIEGHPVPSHHLFSNIRKGQRTPRGGNATAAQKFAKPDADAENRATKAYSALSHPPSSPILKGPGTKRRRSLSGTTANPISKTSTKQRLGGKPRRGTANTARKSAKPDTNAENGETQVYSPPSHPLTSPILNEPRTSRRRSITATVATPRSKTPTKQRRQRSLSFKDAEERETNYEQHRRPKPMQSSGASTTVPKTALPDADAEGERTKAHPNASFFASSPNKRRTMRRRSCTDTTPTPIPNTPTTQPLQRSPRITNAEKPDTNDRQRNLRSRVRMPEIKISLSKDEIAEDYFGITGSLPPKRPTRRPRPIQDLLNNLVPGSTLSKITADKYDVRESTRGL